MNSENSISAIVIDDLLPQTQCGLCGYKGCMPYAKAIVEKGEAINLCVPGGVKTLLALATLLNQDAHTYLADMQAKTKPRLQARIREDECIGCTKCIQACPVDAILGAAKYMHTVIATECTGCELCVNPCPVDCIEMVIVAGETDENQLKQQANIARKRYQFRNARLERDHLEQSAKHQQAKLNQQDGHLEDQIKARKAAIHASVARVKAKKLAQIPSSKI